MVGLWNIATTGTYPSVGLAILHLLYAVVLSMFYYFLVKPWRQLFHTCKIYRIGNICLLTWMLCHSLDLLIRSGQAELTYGYILTDAIFRIPRVFSEIFCLAGFSLILTCRRRYQPRDQILIAASVLLLWIVGLYSICLNFGVCFSWLAVAELSETISLATSMNTLEACYTAFQFCYSVVLFVVAIHQELERDLLIRDANTNPRDQDVSSTEETRPEDKVPFLSLAGAFLILRSLCELIVISVLITQPRRYHSTFQARDVTYGLFSIPFIVLTEGAIWKDAKMSSNLDKYDQAMSQIRQQFKDLLIAETDGETKTAPLIPELINRMRTIMELPEPRTNFANQQFGNELARIGRVYSKWKPIIKRVDA